MSDDLARRARAAILLWEMNPKRQALAKILGLEPGQVTDEMIRQTESGARSFRAPPMQQVPREPKVARWPNGDLKIPEHPGPLPELDARGWPRRR